jgi:hypothetical protein
MTRETKSQKNQFKLNGGLNTELNEIGFPDGYTRDEANYELLVDGSRRRRKGLAIETGGSTRTVATTTTAEFNQSFLWRNVGGDPTKDIVVYRKGTILHFGTADETVSDDWAASSIDFSSYKTSGATTANVDNAPLSFAYGRGRLLVTGQYVVPFYVSFSVAAGYAASLITLRARAFDTIDDGTIVTNEPTGTITDDHRYNLRNRGWNEADLTSFNSLTKWPARNSIWYKGYERSSDTTVGAGAVLPSDGIKAWNSAKIDAEVFGNSSAPTGALLLDPFDTTSAFGVGQTTGSFDISSWTVVDETTTPWVVTITTSAAHGLAGPVARFTIDGNSFDYNGTSGPYLEIYEGSLDGTWYSTSIPAVDEITFTFTPAPPNWASWVDQNSSLGLVDGGPIVRSSGTAHTDSLRAVAWYEGRAFYAGFSNEEFADSIFFSQIVDDPKKYGKCYQEADPTDENFNAIVSTDGGEIVLPGLGSVIDMVALRNALLVFSKDGVWEISGGRGAFTASTQMRAALPVLASLRWKT